MPMQNDADGHEIPLSPLACFDAATFVARPVGAIPSLEQDARSGARHLVPTAKRELVDEHDTSSRSLLVAELGAGTNAGPAGGARRRGRQPKRRQG